MLIDLRVAIAVPYQEAKNLELIRRGTVELCETKIRHMEDLVRIMCEGLEKEGEQAEEHYCQAIKAAKAARQLTLQALAKRHLVVALDETKIEGIQAGELVNLRADKNNQAKFPKGIEEQLQVRTPNNQQRTFLFNSTTHSLADYAGHDDRRQPPFF
jgi:hypothetical protein